MSHALTEGGQITSHYLRMLKQVIKTALTSSLFLSLCVFIFLMSDIPKLVYISSWYYLKAHLLNGISLQIEVSREFLIRVAKINSSDLNLSCERVIALTTPIVTRLIIVASLKLFYSGLFFSLCTSFILAFFFLRGLFSKEKTHLSGSKITSSFWLTLRLKLTGKASNITIGTLPLIKGTETQHLLITGGTGCGKTNCLHHILSQVRKNHNKAIIVDTTGVFLDRYFREGKDVLLNPFDSRGVKWSPWAEGCEAADYASLAEAFIPISQSENEGYWRMASKTVFTSLLEKLSDTKKTSELTKWLEYEKLSSLCNLVVGTKAAAHLDMASEKTASSIRSVASTFLECLDNLKDTQDPFSIRQWMSQNDDSWLFIQCNPSQRALLRPLISAWISSAVRGLLSLPIDLKRRIWFSIDELPSLQRVKDLDLLLTEGRKYGGCAILSFQSPAQLENIYGRDVTKIIIGNTATKIIFRERDPEIAERISRSFGEREVVEIQEGISYGAHEARDGVSLSMQNRTRPVVSASKILELPVNTAYVKLAEENAVTLVKLPIS